jgi:hypothetical protein
VAEAVGEEEMREAVVEGEVVAEMEVNVMTFF